MPELPEVETVLRALMPHVVGCTISQTKVLFPSLRLPLPKNMAELLSSRRILGIKRRAKYLMFELEGGLTMLVHLGMTGKLTLNSDSYVPAKHDHVILHLEDKLLVYNDPRRFGIMDLIETHEISQHKLLRDLGPEPLEPDFTSEYLIKVLRGRRIPIKNAIMDGRIVVGVGNIYASEALFMASISPIRPASSLSLAECSRLVVSIRNVLEEAISSGGSSIRDFVSVDNKRGYFQHHFAVYGKGGRTCQVCSSIIEKSYQSGRATYFCPKCQASS